MANVEKELSDKQEQTIKSIQRMLVLLTAKILEPLGAGLPSCYYEAMEHKSLDEIANIAVQRIKNTKVKQENV